MTWEYRVLHEAHEVAGGTQEDTYGIVEAYYAAPGKVSFPANSPAAVDVVCGRCGVLATRVTSDMALHLSRRHRCPDRVVAWSEPRDAHGETVEDLVSDLVLMLRACAKPVLERRDLPGPGTKVPPSPPRWWVRAVNAGENPAAVGTWQAVEGATMGAAVDAFTGLSPIPVPRGTRFEVKPYDG